MRSAGDDEVVSCGPRVENFAHLCSMPTICCPVLTVLYLYDFRNKEISLLRNYYSKEYVVQEILCPLS